jgi:hypothetical protein
LRGKRIYLSVLKQKTLTALLRRCLRSIFRIGAIRLSATEGGANPVIFVKYVTIIWLAQSKV